MRSAYPNKLDHHRARCFPFHIESPFGVIIISGEIQATALSSRLSDIDKSALRCRQWNLQPADFQVFEMELNCFFNEKKCFGLGFADGDASGRSGTKAP